MFRSPFKRKDINLRYPVLVQCNQHHFFSALFPLSAKVRHGPWPGLPMACSCARVREVGRDAEGETQLALAVEKRGETMQQLQVEMTQKQARTAATRKKPKEN